MACQRGCWMKMMYRRTRFWRAESERAAGLVPALPVASSTLRTLGGHIPIVSKGGVGYSLHGLYLLTMGVKGGRVVLQSAPVRDAAGSPLGCRVCRLQPVQRGRGPSNTRP